MISIDWPSKVITVPKADMSLIQSTPIEVRELNLNTFRLALKALEDDAEGMAWLDTHRHNPAVDIGGITIAMVIEIINGYTITFEDGAYLVNLIGANSNVADRVNPNNVSVRSANSAGLLQSREIEHSAFNQEIVIDVINGVGGTLYPIGTRANPSNNLIDALLIATTRSIHQLRVLGNLTIGAFEDISGYIISGDGCNNTTVTLTHNSITSDTHFRDMTVTGHLHEAAEFSSCCIHPMIEVGGSVFDRCAISGPISFGTSPVLTSFLNCYSADPGATDSVLNLNASTSNVTVNGFYGRLKLTNLNAVGAGVVAVNVDAGKITIDSTCTTGTIKVRGYAQLIDNSNGSDVDDDTATPILDADMANHNTVGTFGKFIKQIKSLVQAGL